MTSAASPREAERTNDDAGPPGAVEERGRGLVGPPAALPNLQIGGGPDPEAGCWPVTANARKSSATQKVAARHRDARAAWRSSAITRHDAKAQHGPAHRADDDEGHVPDAGVAPRASVETERDVDRDPRRDDDADDPEVARPGGVVLGDLEVQGQRDDGRQDGRRRSRP